MKDAKRTPEIDAAAVERHLAAVGSIGALGDGKGYLRASWSDEETAAMRYVAEEAEQVGLATRVDSIGNIAFETLGFETFVETGSHLDTVPSGGNYDGVAGVLCGLEAIAAVLRSGGTRRRGLRLRIWLADNGATKVSGFCYFNVDVRSCEAAFKRDYAERLKQLIIATVSEFRVEAAIEPVTHGEPIEALSLEIVDAGRRAAERCGYRSILLPSGGGHDVMKLGQQRRSDGSFVPVGMLFIPCRGGKSHSPEEHATPKALAAGCEVLAAALAELAAA